MKMGIDARFYGPKTGGGGIGRYVSELVQHLQDLPSPHETSLFLSSANFHECTIRSKKFSKVLADIPWYGFKEQFELPKIIKRSQVDLMHYPHWNVPKFSNIPFVVTIHDLILLEQKNSARTTTRNPLVHAAKYAAFRIILEGAVYKSKAIITISDFSKEQILRYFNVPSEKIIVIPNGVSKPSEESPVSLMEHGIYEPYFLYAGNVYPHKNVELLVDALKLVKQINPYVQVVIAGKRDVFSHRLEAYAKGLGVTHEHLRFIDHPSDHLLSSLYEKAHAFVFPSKLEGFGIPPLEALHHDTPVISSNLRPMTDILQNAAHYIDPDDPDDLARAMLAHLAEPEALRSRLKFKEEILSHYTWQNAAIKTNEVYESILRSL